LKATAGLLLADPNLQETIQERKMSIKVQKLHHRRHSSDTVSKNEVHLFRCHLPRRPRRQQPRQVSRPGTALHHILRGQQVPPERLHTVRPLCSVTLSITHKDRSYSFTVSDQALAIVETHCSAVVDGGFSGYTKLPFVWEGLGKCDSAAVTWTFFQADMGSDATFNVTVGGVKGVYHMPGADISFWVNDEANPFDDDVSYTGPTEFLITDFEE
jgi:hypothetical protein